MREIKFRAYHIEKNRMINIENALHFSNDGDIWINENKQMPVNVFSGWVSKDFRLMQYTGLKDKNGVEIYEGDIVKWGHIKGKEECWHRVAFVELFPCLQFHILHYIDGKTLEKKQGDSYIFGYSNFIYKDTHNSLEVIGNIYENKELLK